jgi:DNA-binding Xre family transcriptional regulator
MGRTRIQPRDLVFWDSIRSLLDQVRRSGEQNWTELAASLGVSKQTLTGFRKGRIPALDAEVVLRLCLRCNVPLGFEGQTISCGNPTLRLVMEFDDSFQHGETATPSATLTRKPAGRVSYIGVRVEQVVGVEK